MKVSTQHVPGLMAQPTPGEIRNGFTVEKLDKYLRENLLSEFQLREEILCRAAADETRLQVILDEMRRYDMTVAATLKTYRDVERDLARAKAHTQGAQKFLDEAASRECVA